MQAILVRQFGGPEVFELAEVPEPQQVHRLPARISFMQGAGLFVPYVTPAGTPRRFGGSERGAEV